MSREKQIEEMAWELCDIPKHPSIKSCEQCGNKHCYATYYAERAINAGYRKQSEPFSRPHENGSEWISVEERLPEGKAPILVTDGGKVIVAYRNWLYRSNSTGRLGCPANYGNGMYLTHWMPLPEPPKMKGGAE